MPMKTQGRGYRITYRFQEGDAPNEISCAPFRPSRSTRPSPASKHHKDNTHGRENAVLQSKEENLTTKLLPSSLRPATSNKRSSTATNQ